MRLIAEVWWSVVNTCIDDKIMTDVKSRIRLFGQLHDLSITDTQTTWIFSSKHSFTMLLLNYNFSSKSYPNRVFFHYKSKKSGE